MTGFEQIITIISAVIGSTGLFTFIQYLISRKDKKNDKLDGLKKSIDELKTDISDLSSDMSKMQSRFQIDISNLGDKIEKSQAIQARIRILRANDEMRQDIHHSYEYFHQLHQDITEYENYCQSHPEFKNNEAVNSIEYINKIYQECLASHNFLV